MQETHSGAVLREWYERYYPGKTEDLANVLGVQRSTLSKYFSNFPEQKKEYFLSKIESDPNIQANAKEKLREMWGLPAVTYTHSLDAALIEIGHLKDLVTTLREFNEVLKAQNTDLHLRLNTLMQEFQDLKSSL